MAQVEFSRPGRFGGHKLSVVTAINPARRQPEARASSQAVVKSRLAPPAEANAPEASNAWSTEAGKTCAAPATEAVTAVTPPAPPAAAVEAVPAIIHGRVTIVGISARCVAVVAVGAWCASVCAAGVAIAVASSPKPTACRSRPTFKDNERCCDRQAEDKCSYAHLSTPIRYPRIARRCQLVDGVTLGGNPETEGAWFPVCEQIAAKVDLPPR
jgi:hypothetical protein